MMLGRFSFGPWTILFPILLNCLACVGWSTINTIVGASALKAVTTHNQLPEPAGIVIIAVITLAVALFGYKYVHAIERYSSIPVFIIFIIMLGQAGRFMEGGYGGVGEGEAASILSFGGTIAGFAFGWTSLAADYTVYQRADTPDWKVFITTYVGLNIPLIFVESLGALMMSTFGNKPSWGEAMETGGLGGLLAAPLVGPMGGFGRFLLVILALSIVANNIPNVYSFALTFQAFGKFAQRIPRFFLCIVCTIIYIVLAEAGYSSFESAFDTLLVLLSYWLAIYSCILLEEHYIFRGGSFTNYDLDSYNTYSKLPMGIAAGVSLCCGIAGAVLGMAQTWYVGVIGRLIGDPKFGADLGFELAFGFTAITYPVCRYLERKYTGR
jgi:NCS1 nucleoside transporter family